MQSNVQRSTSAFISQGTKQLNLNTARITTERLNLLPVTDDYAEHIFREFTQEIALYMIPSQPEDISETKAFIAETTKLRSQNADLVLVILNKDTKEFLGVCGLHPRQNPRQPEFGIWLKASAHGHGYGKEAITGLYDWALQTIEADFFIYPVDKDNIPSKKIPESLGGEIFEEKEVPTMDGGTLDEIVFKIPFRAK